LRHAGRIERHRERLVQRMCAKGIDLEFAERVFEQIRGFGEYGFPESHAASFALIAYATAWMKCHHHDAFTCSLLNAQPMGFYSISTIVEDSKRHGVEIRPVDVQRSCWDCTLEPAEKNFAVRMGVRYVKGFHERHWERIETTRRQRAFTSIEDLVRRTGLQEGSLTRLAEAGAFAGLDRKDLAVAENRRAALWKVRGAVATPETPLPIEVNEATPEFVPLDAFETISWDYDTTRHSPRGHPLGPLREALLKRKLPDARSVTSMSDGQRVRYAGMVICRQRPGTASGVVFMTLEDETGFVNVVIWSKIFDEHAVLIKTSSFLGITGKLQVQDGVVHLIAEGFWTPPLRLRPSSGGSHDFH
jgi:error-prone DNA polymerase